MLILIQLIWDGAQKSAFLRSSQKMLMVYGPTFHSKDLTDTYQQLLNQNHSCFSMWGRNVRKLSTASWLVSQWGQVLYNTSFSWATFYTRLYKPYTTPAEIPNLLPVCTSILSNSVKHCAESPHHQLFSPLFFSPLFSLCPLPKRGPKVQKNRCYCISHPIAKIV